MHISPDVALSAGFAFGIAFCGLLIVIGSRVGRHLRGLSVAADHVLGWEDSGTRATATILTTDADVNDTRPQTLDQFLEELPLTVEAFRASYERVRAEHPGEFAAVRDSTDWLNELAAWAEFTELEELALRYAGKMGGK